MPTKAEKMSRREKLIAGKSFFNFLIDETDAALKRQPTDEEIIWCVDETFRIRDWALEFCGHMLRDQKTGRQVPFAAIHLVTFAALLYHLRVLVILPRGFGKSTICTKIYPLYCICEKTKRYMMLGSYVKKRAIAFVVNVRTELETNQKIKDYYGDLRPVDGTWSDEVFITADNIRVEAIYYGYSGVRGAQHDSARPDLVVLDDLETKDEAKNPDRVAEVLNWIFDEIYKLYYDIQVVIVGTILHDGSAIHQLMESAEMAVVDEMIMDSEQTDPKERVRLRLVKCEACDENFENLAWEELFDRPRLIAMYGTTEREHEAFEQEMRHLPRSVKMRPFKVFHSYDPQEIIDEELRAYGFVDLIPGESKLKERQGKDPDYYARVGVGHSRRRGKIYVLSAWNERNLDQVGMVKDSLEFYSDMHEVDSAFQLVVESNGFQIWFSDLVNEIGAEVGTFPNVIPMDSKGNKWDIIESIANLTNTGKILFDLNDPYQRVLVEELKRLRTRCHDDLAEALAKSVKQIRQRGGGETEIEIIEERRSSSLRRAM